MHFYPRLAGSVRSAPATASQVIDERHRRQYRAQAARQKSRLSGFDGQGRSDPGAGGSCDLLRAACRGVFRYLRENAIGNRCTATVTENLELARLPRIVHLVLLSEDVRLWRDDDHPADRAGLSLRLRGRRAADPVRDVGQGLVRQSRPRAYRQGRQTGSRRRRAHRLSATGRRRVAARRHLRRIDLRRPAGIDDSRRDDETRSRPLMKFVVLLAAITPPLILLAYGIG